VRAHFPGGDREICGAIYGSEARIVHIDGYTVDIAPFGPMIVTQHTDQPGIIGRVGTLLGEAGVNIGGMHVGREGAGKRAIMALMVDSEVSGAMLDAIRAIPGMEAAQSVNL
jgi:D-3-phosphoglycerate dehydrogenase